MRPYTVGLTSAAPELYHIMAMALDVKENPALYITAERKIMFELTEKSCSRSLFWGHHVSISHPDLTNQKK